jgi:predicted secreted protein
MRRRHCTANSRLPGSWQLPLRARGRLAGGMLAVAIGLASVGAASAADISTPEEPAAPVPAASGWTFAVTPYVWMSSMSGEVKYGSLQANFDSSFSEILDHLDFAAMGTVEARYDRFSVFSDLLYMKLSADAKVERFGLEADFGTEILQWTPAVAYSIAKTERGHFDVLAGARVWSVETSLNVSDTNSQKGLDRDHSATWVDAIIGVKGQYSLTDSVFLSGWAMVGGGSSDYNWDLLGSVGYKFNDRFSAMAGYRAQGIDFEKGSFVFNQVLQGPIIGGTIKF